MKKTYRNIGFFHLIKIFINKNKMRRFDKKHNISKVNLLAEQRYLQSKGLINENIGDIETFEAGDNVSFDDYSKNPIEQCGVIIGKLNDKNLSPKSTQFYYSVQLIPSGEKVPVRNDSLKKINKPIDEISGELKRSAFDAAINKYNNTADWDVANKSKYGDQAKLAMTHISPEVERDIESFAKRFDLSVSFNKAVGDEHNVPYINLYFNKAGESVDDNNYQFMINILPMKYNYSPGYRNQDDTQIRPPQGFDRAIVKLIKYIQSKELSFFSSLNK
jgi:hypothetical protein